MCVCVCVCPLMKHTHTDTQTRLNPHPGDLQLFGWRVEVKSGPEETSYVCGERRAAQATLYAMMCWSVHWIFFSTQLFTVSTLAAKSMFFYIYIYIPVVYLQILTLFSVLYFW